MRVEKQISFQTSLCVFTRQEIVQSIREKYVGMCTKEDGFYQTAEPVIHTLYSSPNGYILCKGILTVTCYLPREGEEVEARVDSWYDRKGIFLYHHSLKIIIPARYIEMFTLSEEKIIREGGAPIVQGSLLDVKIVKVRYQQGKYVAVAVLN